MGKIKGWSKSKTATFGDWWDSDFDRTSMVYVIDDQCVTSPKCGLWYVRIVAHRRKLPKKYFKTKALAMTYAINYMKKHPSG